MQFIILCLGMPFNGETIKHQSLGGSESAAYYVAKELAKTDDVIVFTNHPEEGAWDGVRYLFAGQQTEQTPMGDRFHFYASSTPHDVLIIQRVPNAFAYNFASKINLWWVHDLALYRHKALVDSQLHNIDAVLTVSDYHKRQIMDVYGIDESRIATINNGVDLSLFAGSDPAQRQAKTLLYSSRPERGLENLVAPGGIMEQLGPEYHLQVCGYDNTTEQMRPYYEWLWKRIDELPNCVNLGSLSKAELADVMETSTALAYPTTFEEVSCITAMEAMAAGLPFISTAHAALPETCRGSGSTLVEVKGGYDNPRVDTKAFVQAIRKVHEDPATWTAMHKAQLAAAKNKGWAGVADNLMFTVHECFEGYSMPSRLRRLVDNSDYYAAKALSDRMCQSKSENALGGHIRDELKTCYAFTDNPKAWGQHYEDYYEYEKQRGVEYGPESLDGENRFEAVSNRLAGFLGGSLGSVVLDYGCAHGHYTINLAKRFPGTQFVGIDIAESNIEKAKEWANAECLDNVSFFVDDTTTGLAESVGAEKFDAIIAAEVLEHVARPEEVANVLLEKLRPNGMFLATTPFGPWEAIGYKQHWPWRAHVHHFEKADLALMFGELEGLEINVIPASRTRDGELVGSYMLSGHNTDIGHRMPEVKAIPPEHYAKKIATTKGRDTLSLCMIVKDAECDIARALQSVADEVDEVVIRVDSDTTDRTRTIIDEFLSQRPWLRSSIFEGPSPLHIGFAAARNQTLRRATADWVLWLDSDEVVVKAQNIRKYLRANQFGGYALQQHHFSVEPLGVLKTDMPCKIFRNHKGIRFFGVVHEHPEMDLNKGVGHVKLLPDIHIMHNSYLTEDVRRARFARNIRLMERDRELLPNRTLGKMLWVRDVAQMIQFSRERTGTVDDGLRQKAADATQLWEQLVEENLRMATESLGYYSTLVEAVAPPTAVQYSFAVDVQNPGSHDKPEPKVISGIFHTIDAAHSLRDKVERDRARLVGSRYA